MIKILLLHLNRTTNRDGRCLFYGFTCKQGIHRSLHITFRNIRSIAVIVINRTDVAHDIFPAFLVQQKDVRSLGSSVLRINFLSFVQQIRESKSFVRCPFSHFFHAVFRLYFRIVRVEDDCVYPCGDQVTDVRELPGGVRVAVDRDQFRHLAGCQRLGLGRADLLLPEAVADAAAVRVADPVIAFAAGIRSGDWTMPEEINRMVTDAITNWFFTTSDVANQNLMNSGVSKERIFFVGNTMIDTLLANLDRLGTLRLPLLVGLSRKSTLGALTGRPVEGRLAAGVAAAVLAVERGAHIVRTHDVAATLDALKVTAAVMRLG